MRQRLHRTHLSTAFIVLTGSLLFAAASGPVSAQEPPYHYFFPKVFDNIDYNLKFAYKIGSSWAYEVVDAPGDVGMFNAVGIGADNRVRIAYLDATNGDLKFAVRLALSP